MLILPETTPDEGFLQFSGVYLEANLLGFPGNLARFADSAGKELLSYSHALAVHRAILTIAKPTHWTRHSLQRCALEST